jgi:hypothetical protein
MVVLADASGCLPDSAFDGAATLIFCSMLGPSGAAEVKRGEARAGGPPGHVRSGFGVAAWVMDA